MPRAVRIVPTMPRIRPTLTPRRRCVLSGVDLRLRLVAHDPGDDGGDAAADEADDAQHQDRRALGVLGLAAASAVGGLRGAVARLRAAGEAGCNSRQHPSSGPVRSRAVSRHYPPRGTLETRRTDGFAAGHTTTRRGNVGARRHRRRCPRGSRGPRGGGPGGRPACAPGRGSCPPRPDAALPWPRIERDRRGEAAQPQQGRPRRHPRPGRAGGRTTPPGVRPRSAC